MAFLGILAVIVISVVMLRGFDRAAGRSQRHVRAIRRAVEDCAVVETDGRVSTHDPRLRGEPKSDLDYY